MGEAFRNPPPPPFQTGKPESNPATAFRMQPRPPSGTKLCGHRNKTLINLSYDSCRAVASSERCPHACPKPWPAVTGMPVARPWWRWRWQMAMMLFVVATCTAALGVHNPPVSYPQPTAPISALEGRTLVEPMLNRSYTLVAYYHLTTSPPRPQPGPHFTRQLRRVNDIQHLGRVMTKGGRQCHRILSAVLT
jgi:hypothetical protein